MQGMTSRWNRIAMVCFVLVLAGCAKSREAAKSTEPAKTFQMRGEITGLDASGHVATIRHEAIPGFMGAMTMGYPVKDAAEFTKLAVGEPITATVYESGDDYWIGN